MNAASSRSSWTALYYKYRGDARRRGFLFELSRPEFQALATQACLYCGVPPSQSFTRKSVRSALPAIYTGVDRVDNEAGYLVANCVPCCYSCNHMKHRLPMADFLAHTEQIWHNRYRTKSYLGDRAGMTNVKRTKEEKDAIVASVDARVAAGDTLNVACKAVGISWDTYTAWKAGTWKAVTEARKKRETAVAVAAPTKVKGPDAAIGDERVKHIDLNKIPVLPQEDPDITVAVIRGKSGAVGNMLAQIFGPNGNE